MKIIVFRDSKDGFLNYLRSSDGKTFPLQMQDGIVKIKEQFSEIQNATDYEMIPLRTEDGIPTYKMCCKPRIIGGGGGGRGPAGPEGPAGPQGPAGPEIPPQLFANALFVDAVFGNDTNAIPHSLMDSTTNPTAHKYKTIEAARDAANSGDVIIVYPGEYTPTSNLYKNGVVYYFYPDANVLGNIPTDALFGVTGVGHTCSVYGKANLRNTADAFGLVVYSGLQGTIYVECNNISSKISPVYNSDGYMTIIANDVNCENDNSTVTLNDGVGTGNIFNLTCNTLRCTHSIGGTNSVFNCANGGQGWSGTANVKARQIIGSPNNTAFIISMDNSCTGVGDIKATITIEADEIVVLNKTSANAIVGNFSNTYTKFILNTNINLTSSARKLIQIFSGQTGSENIVNGNFISDTGESVVVSSTNGITRLNGVFKSNNTTTGTVTTTGTNKLFIDGEIQNTTVAGVGLLKSAASPNNDVVVGNLKIVTGGGVTVSAGVGDTVKVVHSLAMNNVSSPVAAALNSIVGSICYTDAGVE